MLSQDSEDEIRSRFVFEVDFGKMNSTLARVRCAFGNVLKAQTLSNRMIADSRIIYHGRGGRRTGDGISHVIKSDSRHFFC